MRRVMAVLSVMAMVALAAGSLQAGYIVPDWEYNWGSPTSESPTATTGGLWWLNTGSGPQPLTIDINLEVWGGTTKNNTSLCYSGSYPAILLVSDHSGYGSYEAVTQWQPSYPGMFSAGAYRGDLVPGTTQQDGATAWIEIKAWTGDYARYSDALAASQAGQAVYVADVEFQSPTSSITTVPIQAMQDSPAMVLAKAAPAPEPSTFLLSVAGLVGLATYAWRRRR